VIVDGAVHLNRTYPVGVADVWDAFTHPEQMTWMWAEMGADPRATADVRPGGHYRVAMDQPPGTDGWESGERAMEGVYAVVEPERRLVFTLHWDAPVGYNQRGTVVPDEVVVVDFSPVGEGCQVEFRHFGIPDDGVSPGGHDEGDAASLDHLGSLLAMERGSGSP